MAALACDARYAATPLDRGLAQAQWRKRWFGLTFSGMAEFRVDVWSDIACPWCYVGKRRLERALKDFPHADEVNVIWHSFELDPSAPKERDPGVSHAERIAKKYGISVDQARKNSERLQGTARGEGLAFDFEHIRSGNTFDAHRVVHLAKHRGLQDAVKERLLKEAELMSDHGTLARLAAEAGLDEGEVTDMLASDQFTDDVRADESAANQLGISGVPCFVFDGKFAVSGAQPPEVILSALHQAWTERDPAPSEFSEGAVCGPDGC